MNYGRLPGIPKPLSRLVQGTVMVSASRWDESSRLLDGVFELGCTCFDTAHVYGGGDNERTVGRWVRERGVREEVVILGKGAHPDGDRQRVTPEDIASDLTESLDRFGFTYLDLYLLHRDDPSVPVDEIVSSLNEHFSAGRILAFGGSNWSHTRLEAANAYAKSQGLVPMVASSPQFGLAFPSEPVWEGCITIGGPDDEQARTWYRRHAPLTEPGMEADDGYRMALFPWSSLGGGFFSERFTRSNLASFESYFDRLCARVYGHEENFRRLERARRLAASKGHTAAQIALAWLFHQGMNLFALVGCATADEFAVNAGSFHVSLTEREVRWLETGA